MGSTVKAQILKAYFEICNEEGIESVTLQKVADRSHVALTSVRYHFQLKGLSLSQVALQYVSDTTYEWIHSGLQKAREAANFNPVLAYIQGQFDWIEQQPLEASFLVYYYYLCTTKTPVSIENKDLVEIAQKRILGLIHEGMGLKLYAVAGDPVALSRVIHMLVMGCGIIIATCRNSEFARQQKDSCLKFVSRLLGI